MKAINPDQRLNKTVLQGKRDGNPTKEALNIESLNNSGSMSLGNTNRKLGMDVKYSDGDKIYATGIIIKGIQI